MSRPIANIRAFALRIAGAFVVLFAVLVLLVAPLAAPPAAHAATGSQTPNLKDTSDMFNGCTNLEEANLSPLDTTNVTNSARMFEGCNKLESVILGIYFKFSDTAAMGRLPNPPTTNGYIGKWAKGSPYGSTRYTSEELATAFNDNPSALAGQWVWARNLTLTYNANGGTGTLSGMSTDPNLPANTVLLEPQGDATSVTTTVASHTGFERYRFTFTGWNTKPDGSGTGYAENASITVTEETTLYAQWSFQEQQYSGSQTPYLINTSDMFDGCTNLEEVNVSNLDTMGCEEMGNMFGVVNNSTPKLCVATFGDYFRFKGVNYGTDPNAAIASKWAILPASDTTQGYNGDWVEWENPTTSQKDPYGTPQYSPEDLRDWHDGENDPNRVDSIPSMAGTYIWARSGAIYHANDGTQDTIQGTDSTARPGSIFTPPSRKEFQGWNTEPDGSGTWFKPGDEIPPGTGNLYAIWDYSPIQMPLSGVAGIAVIVIVVAIIAMIAFQVVIRVLARRNPTSADGELPDSDGGSSATVGEAAKSDGGGDAQ